MSMTTTRTAGKLYIGGAWREGSTGERHEVLDPATGRSVGDVAWASADDVDAAVAAAKEAFDDGRWSRMSPRDRSAVLLRVAVLMRERAEELAQAESLDVGKPITFARTVDVPGAIDEFDYYAALARSLDGAVRGVAMPAFAYTRPEPMGVVGAITPFNFPLILTTSKLAPALAAGNSIVHKPSEDTPLSALVLAEILEEAGLPAGVYNLITGAGPALGERLVEHPDVSMVAFTGSTAVGQKVSMRAAELFKPVMTELGGNAANIVFADADLDAAVGTVIASFVYNTGQFCMSGPRLLVERPLHDTLVGILKDAVGQVPLGRPSDPETVIGPLVSARQRDRVDAFVRKAEAEGGTVVAGGSPVDLDGGFYYPPTVITGLANDTETVQEEIFGPVLTVQAFDTEEEAIALANSTRYGLAAGVQTADVLRGQRVAHRLHAGMVWVNGWTMMDTAVPFGGVKNSGQGRENGPEALQSYLRTKSVVISTPNP